MKTIQKSSPTFVGASSRRPCYKDRTQEKGITLVALIITIIVLIIMAAVTIFAFTESGLLKTATKGTENYANVQEYEKQIMDNIDKHAQNIVKDITEGSGNGGGGETLPTPEEPELPKGWESSKVYAVQSADSTKVTVPIPIGFVMSGIEEEKKVSTGLVIYEIQENEREGISWTADTNGNNYPDVQERYNQFVWVPVAEPSEMFGIDKDGNYLGKLYTFSKSGEQTVVTANNWTETTNVDGKKIMTWQNILIYHEPDIVDYDGANATSNASYFKAAISSTMTGAEFKDQLQNEFKAMKESVEKYNGFYIGRYETGNLSQNKAVVARNNNDIANKNWYQQYQKNKGIAEGKSSMIWGCQWDAVMKWFLSSEDAETRKYVTNSTGKGNYAGTQAGGQRAIPTGSNKDYSINNICDMAGNVSDMTIEAANGSRVFRRGRLQR